MRGNRDLLLGERFAAAAGATLLPEQIVVDLAGTPTLLLHGDELCTDDVALPALPGLRRAIRARQRRFLALPYVAAARRRRLAAAARAAGRPRPRREAIMDVKPAPSRRRFAPHGVTRMIHGHTHRPAHHQLVVDGRACERWVLADWYDRGSYLEVGRRPARGCARCGRVVRLTLSAYARAPARNRR